MLRITILISVSFILNGCVHIETPPESWGELQPNVEVSGCGNISGKYSNAGTKPNGNEVYLASWLAPEIDRKSFQKEYEANQKFLVDLDTAKTVEVILEENKHITISALGDGIARSWTMEKIKIDFECVEGVLKIPKGELINDGGVLGAKSGSMDIYRNKEHLFINSHGLAGGMFFFIPAVGYGSSWAKFSVINE